MSEQLLVRLTKLTEQNQGNVFTYTTKHKETRKHKRFRQKIVFFRCKKNRQIIIKEEGSKEEDSLGKKKLMEKATTKNKQESIRRFKTTSSNDKN